MSTKTAQERRRYQRTEVLLDGGFEATRIERVTRRHKELKWFADEALGRFHARQHVSFTSSDSPNLGSQIPNDQNLNNVKRNDDSPITTDADEISGDGQVSANENDPLDVSSNHLESKILAELNRRLERTHLAGLNELHLDHPQLVSFYRQLLNDPFGIDPDDYSDILIKAQQPSEPDPGRCRNTSVEQGEQTSDIQVEDSENPEALSDQEAKEEKEKEKADTRQCYTHYVRVLRITSVEAISLLDQWEHKYPIDWWHIQTKRLALATHTSDISWLYFGASVAEDAESRDQHDWETVFGKTKGASTKANQELSEVPLSRYNLSSRLHRFISLLGNRRFEVYTIKPFCFTIEHLDDEREFPRSVDRRNLMEGHPELWWAEKSLIAAGTTELLLNSKQGGCSIPFQPSPEVRKVVDQCLLDFPPGSNQIHTSDLKQDIAEHYREARSIAEREKQTPISRHALEAVIEEASLTRRRPDGTTLFANVAKDITLRAAFSNASTWYGKTAGEGPLNYRRAQAIARGDLFEFCDEDTEINLFDYGPIVNFWAVCISHILFLVFCTIFWQTIAILKPRVVVCQSDKVSAVLRQGTRTSETSKSDGDDETSQPDDLATTMQLASKSDDLMNAGGSGHGIEPRGYGTIAGDGEQDIISGSDGKENHGIEGESDGEDDGNDTESNSSYDGDGNWKDAAEGDFIRCWIGRVLVVSTRTKPMVLDGHTLLILHIIDCGFLAYKPDLAWWLFDLTVLLAVKARVMVCLVERVELWDLASAAEVVSQLETSLDHLEMVLQERLQTYLQLQNALYSLSRSRSLTHEQLVQENQKRSAQMIKIRNKTLDSSIRALGKPDSDERATQMTVMSSIASEEAVTVPCPPGMKVGDEDWEFWLMSRKEGCFLVESARSLGQSDLKASAARARQGLANALDRQRTNPGYSGDYRAEDVLLWLADIDTCRNRLKSVTEGFRLVTCCECSQVGIVDANGKHYCKIDGQVQPGIPINFKEKVSSQFEIVRLLAPAQLLAHPRFTEHLYALADTGLDDYHIAQSSLCKQEEDLPPVMLMFSRAQHEADEGLVDLFIEFQEVVMATVETQVVRLKQRELKDILWCSHMQDHIISRHFEMMVRRMKQHRQIQGIEAFQPGDLPLDWVSPHGNPFEGDTIPLDE